MASIIMQIIINEFRRNMAPKKPIIIAPQTKIIFNKSFLLYFFIFFYFFFSNMDFVNNPKMRARPLRACKKINDKNTPIIATIIAVK